jgi:hypothetical protein
MNDLEKFFYQNNGRLINKWLHYFDIYDRHFSKLRGKDITILEIGVFQGGSLNMWRDYFGPKAKIYGIDINPNCKQLEGDNIEIFIGSQEDRDFLRSVKKNIPKLDLIIDDGGHTMRQQIASFEELFNHVKDDGIYMIEDTHTSYWSSHGGGYLKRGSFIEYSKKFIDYIHAWYSHEKSRLDVSDFTKTVQGLHYYDSIIVIEKGKKERPVAKHTGQEHIPNYYPKRSLWKKVKARLISDKPDYEGLGSV